MASARASLLWHSKWQHAQSALKQVCIETPVMYAASILS